MGDVGKQPAPGRFDAPVQAISPPKVGQGGYLGFDPREEILPKGWQLESTSKPLPCDIRVQHDFGVKVRDGAKLFMDIFGPTDMHEKVPALICWSPFGKKFTGKMSLKLMTPWDLGIPPSRLSGIERFEAPDPADWVKRGYAIVNVDSRGSGDSEGVCAIMGSQEAEDGYDVIEEVAKQPWCNGKVALAGNSHLAIIQWFIAALQPPSLTCIAPWEGCGDLYREQFARGGIYNGDLFDNLIAKYMINGRHGMESFKLMYKQSPLANAWWNDKRPDMSKINIPTYITGTWSNTMHGMGAIRGWMQVNTDKKWLRFHATQEWYDLWGSQQAVDELFLFFDRYLKDIDNDWEKTPHVRMAALRYGERQPIENIVEDNFPIPRTQYRKLYLAKGNQLLSSAPQTAMQASYHSECATDALTFRHTFTETTSLIGMPKAILYMSTPDLDDMDVYICLRKLSKTGEPMLSLNIPWNEHIPVKTIAEIPDDKRTEVILYTGPVGILRASHREINWSKSMHENYPYHPHEKEEKIAPGTIVKLEIGIWAMGVEYEAGESIEVHIGGRYPGIANFGANNTLNRGRHFVHFGGEYTSHVILPFV